MSVPSPVSASSPTRTVRKDLWRPTGSLCQNMPRQLAATVISLATTRMDAHGGIEIAKGETVSSITFISGNTAGSAMTHQWFALIDTAGNILGKTTDDTSTAWAADAPKTLSLSTPYVATADIAVFCGCLVVGTVPNLVAVAATRNGVMQSTLPVMGRTGTAVLSDPASQGSTYSSNAFGVGNQVAYCYVS